MQGIRYDTALAFFPVRDLAATRDFYLRDLGLRLARDQGTCLILAAGSGHVGFCLADEPETAGRDGGGAEPIITFVTDQVDEVYARLRSLGVELEGAPRHEPRFGIRHFFARDPDGYRVEVQRFDVALE